MTDNNSPMFTGNLNKEAAPVSTPLESKAAAVAAAEKEHQQNVLLDNQALEQARQVINQAEANEEKPVAAETQANAAEIASVTQELRENYVEKAAQEQARTVIDQAEKTAEPSTTAAASDEIATVVVNGLKQEVDSEKVMQANLGGDPETAKTWRAILSEKLRKIIDSLLGRNKKELIDQANQEKKV
ncbi:MAG: hypothetical protein Q4G02_00875 [bacterium]|nr:hypothetical protein [bacterium]